MSEKTVPSTATATAVKTKTYRRQARNILIHKPMQREFSLVLIGLLMVSTFAVGYVIHSTIREVAFSGYRFGKISPFEVLSDISYQLVVRVSCILFVTLIIVAIYGVFFLRRVAGPVYRFRQTFLKLNDGEIPANIHLREGDYFTETATEINRLIQRMKFERDRCKQISEKLNKLMSSNAGESVTNTAKEIKALMEQEPRD